MKVCFITTTYPRFDGDYKGQFIKALVDKLKLNSEVEVVSPRVKYSRLISDSGIQYNLKNDVIAILQFPLFFISFILDSLRAGKNSDVIHANWIISAIPGLFVKLFYKKPLILTIRGSDFYMLNGFFKKLLANFIIKRVDSIICISKSLMADVQKCYPDKILKIIYNGVDTDMFKSDDKVQIRKKLSIDRKCKVILFVGRLVESKGIDKVLESFKQLSKKHANLVLIIVGDGVLKNQIEDEIKKSNLNVRMIGKLPHEQVADWMRASDIFLFPSHFEGGSNTLLEAMSSELAVVITQVGWAKDLIKDGENGMFIESASESIIEKLNFLLKDNKNLKQLGKSARKTIIANGFRWRDCAAFYAKEYNALLKN